MATEVEAKFLAAGAAELDALAVILNLGEADLGPPMVVDELDIYLDTTDDRLAAAGWACRLRDRGTGWIVSLKGPPESAGADGIHRRPEHEGPATVAPDPSAWPSSAARDELLRLSGGGPMVERLRLMQRRTEREVHVVGRRVATLSLDVVDARRPSDDARATFHVVELELSSDDPSSVAALERLAAALAARPGLRPDPRTKLEHALAVVPERD